MESTAGGPPVKAGRKEWIGLAVLALPTLLVSLDVFVMLLALPKLSTALHADGVEQLWITDIYGFMLAGFLITMGTLGDRIGRRKLLLIGATAFTVASLVSAYSVNPAMLIAARALLGIAGATLAPSTLSLISTMFTDAKQRGTAIGIWMMCFSGGAIIGPIVGGAMLDSFWWGSVFLLGVPAMVLLLVLGPILLPEYRNPDAGRLDPLSVAESLAAIIPVIYGLKEISNNGWKPWPVAAVVFGLVVAVFFVRRQRRLTHPLLDLRLFANRSFSTALGGMLFGTMLTGVIMLFVTQDLELAHGLTPLQAGLWMLPAVLTNTISFGVSPLVARRIRPAYVIGGGLLISVSGLLVMAFMNANDDPWVLILGFALVFLGAGPMVTLGAGLVIGSAPPEKAGSAAAINETSGQFGFAFGIAALGTLSIAVYRGAVADKLPRGLPEDVAAAARDTLTAALSAAERLAGGLGAETAAAARAAFVSGLNTVAAVCAGVLLIVAVLVAALLRHVPPTGQAAEDGGAGAPAGPAEAEEERVAAAD
ncbi:MFS transporter [Streptomyces sp. NPDC059788]|uniref:MFS transporter n=1 Tax=Streptomyces sp. NPDC059788 TaxID=3346948 RepID=UPI003648FBAD